MESKIISSYDGTKLFLKKEVPVNPKAIVLIVHGLCEHQGRYNYLTQKLNEKGFGVYRFDHRGHGKSEGPKVYYDDYTQIFEDVNVVVELIKNENPHLAVFLIGHSMGGYAGALYGSNYPYKIDGYILSGALTRNNANIGAELDRDLDPKTYFPNELGPGICSNPKVVEAYVKDPLVEKEISAGLFYSLFNGLDWLKENGHRFLDPVIILHGGNDGLVSNKDSRDFYGDIASEDKTLKIYAKLYHEIFNEYSRDEVIGDVLFWLEKQLDPRHMAISYATSDDSMIADMGI
ncbi:alpha/beta hydrolase [Alkalibacter saccharofermentans]|uniref:Lysophospholipase n=1 Tax=Alkalibacter saccharofermentans DSM 14828 TaxID=1120975 RepID=A0A1M4YJ86_9FIRM|nr:alpha/beta hydrolase [Alkalibacter saccharofermentans]SHF05915.1 lysophospholipase [Alkalibacter saccharofermentans DSM 14828]